MQAYWVDKDWNCEFDLSSCNDALYRVVRLLFSYFTFFYDKPGFQSKVLYIGSTSAISSYSTMPGEFGEHSPTKSIDSNASTLPPDKFIETHESTPTSIVLPPQTRPPSNREEQSTVNGPTNDEHEKQLQVLQNIVKTQSREILALHWAILQLGSDAPDRSLHNIRDNQVPTRKKIVLEQVAQLCDDVRMWSAIPTNLTLPVELAPLPASTTESESRLGALYSFIFETASKGDDFPDSISLRSVVDVVINAVRGEPTPIVCSMSEDFFSKFLELGLEHCSQSIWFGVVVEDIFDPLLRRAKQEGWTRLCDTMRNICARGISIAASRLASDKSSTNEKVVALEISSILSSVLDAATLERIPENDLGIIGRRNIHFTEAVRAARNN